LNFDVASTCTSTTNGPLNFLFDTPILGVKVDKGLLLTKLCLFRQCAVNLNDDTGSPLFWWKEHARLYPNVAFLARHILAIHGSQIEIERIFFVARVLTNIHCCKLGFTNLDASVTIYKNWSEDA
jgi:hypothetical protein